MPWLCSRRWLPVTQVHPKRKRQPGRSIHSSTLALAVPLRFAEPCGFLSEACFARLPYGQPMDHCCAHTGPTGSRAQAREQGPPKGVELSRLRVPQGCCPPTGTVPPKAVRGTRDGGRDAAPRRTPNILGGSWGSKPRAEHLQSKYNW